MMLEIQTVPVFDRSALNLNDSKPLQIGKRILDGEQPHPRAFCHRASRETHLGVEENTQCRDLALCAEDMIQQMGRTLSHGRNLFLTKKLVKLLIYPF
jgi:hypothetical protein